MAILRKVAWVVIASCRSLVQILPPQLFSTTLLRVFAPKVRGIFGLKTQKTGPGAVSLTIPKPVFSDFSVFFLVSALKARKLPDLSGRQIRQLICERLPKRSRNGGKKAQK